MGDGVPGLPNRDRFTGSVQEQSRQVPGVQRTFQTLPGLVDPELLGRRRCHLQKMLSVKVVAGASMDLLLAGPERMQFDVASIKPNNDNQDDQGGSIARTPGGLIARNAPF